MKLYFHILNILTIGYILYFYSLCNMYKGEELLSVYFINNKGYSILYLALTQLLTRSCQIMEYILRKTMEGYWNSIPFLTLITINFNMHIFKSSRYLLSKYMFTFSYTSAKVQQSSKYSRDPNDVTLYTKSSRLNAIFIVCLLRWLAAKSLLAVVHKFDT